jgi:membrane protease YdiL (CAAX protease family)
MTDPWLLSASERLTASLGAGPGKGKKLDMGPFWVFLPLFLGVFGIYGFFFARYVPAGTSYWLDLLLGCAVLAVGCFALHHEYRPSLTQLGLQAGVFRSPRVRRWTYIAIGVAVALKAIPLVLAYLRGPAANARLLPVVQEAWEHLPSSLIVYVVLAPVVEEFTFRGYVYLVLRQNWGDILAELVASAIFAALHGAHLPYYFGLSLLWIYFNNRAGSLWPSISAHILSNAGLLIFPPVPGIG